MEYSAFSIGVCQTWRTLDNFLGFWNHHQILRLVLPPGAFLKEYLKDVLTTFQNFKAKCAQKVLKTTIVFYKVFIE